MTNKSDIAISVRNLSKTYSIAHNAPKHTTMGEALMHRLRHPFQQVEKETFSALKDVSFDIQKGDVVGIIGRNGAGKSTLLKVLSRITEPTTGQIDIYGRVGSLLEVGTGFHPELTGRENIYMNGAILGMTKREITKHFDAIVDFAGVEQFLDTPVKRYSSGMYVRLAFAVAAHLNPEILIVDEVLAVGDAAFQTKCLGKMRDVATNGRTVLFVSHDMSAINSLCLRGILLHEGSVAKIGDTHDVVSHYLSAANRLYSPVSALQMKTNEGEMRLIETVIQQAHKETTCIDCRDTFTIIIKYELLKIVPNLRIFFLLRNAKGEIIFGSSDYDDIPNPATTTGIFESEITVPARLLKTGTVYGTVGADVARERIVFTAEDVFQLDVIENGGNTLSERHARPGAVAPLLKWSSALVGKSTSVSLKSN